MRKILSKTSLIILTLSLLGLFTLSTFSGCVYMNPIKKVKLTHFQTGQVLHGEYNQVNKTVTVTMPDNEVLRGQYSVVSDSSHITISKPGELGVDAHSRRGGEVYAMLTSETSGLVMEILVKYDKGGGGFGIAKTNNGRTYRVQF